MGLGDDQPPERDTAIIHFPTTWHQSLRYLVNGDNFLNDGCLARCRVFILMACRWTLLGATVMAVMSHHQFHGCQP